MERDLCVKRMPRKKDERDRMGIHLTESFPLFLVFIGSSDRKAEYLVMSLGHVCKRLRHTDADNKGALKTQRERGNKNGGDVSKQCKFRELV